MYWTILQDTLAERRKKNSMSILPIVFMVNHVRLKILCDRINSRLKPQVEAMFKAKYECDLFLHIYICDYGIDLGKYILADTGQN